LDTFCSIGTAHAGQPAIVEQSTVYFQPGRFGGWPANHGIWAWGNEIVVGFSVGYYQDRGVGFHAIDHNKPERHILARSLDGGHAWSLEDPERQGVLIGTKGMRHGTLPTTCTSASRSTAPGASILRIPTSP
jgi:hypothetical protein